MWILRFLCFFFNQKTAYEMRISDWSSDVCSSDLELGHRLHHIEIADARQQAHSRARINIFRPQRNTEPQIFQIFADDFGFRHQLSVEQKQIGRASWRERVCQYV